MCIGIPSRIVQIIDADAMTAEVDVNGVRRQVNIACVVETGQQAQSCVGDWVLVQAGVASGRLDAREAAETLALLAELAEVQRQLEADPADSPR